jgi:1-acyl-sn-glycerol-3-phosphate acyltransferase
VYTPEEGSRLFRRFANVVLRTLICIMLKAEVTGTDNMPVQGPFVAMYNHIYGIDPVLLGALAPRYIVIMSKIENYDNPLLGLVMKLYGTFPIHRGEADLKAIRTSLQVLRRGHGLMVAPEGTRSPTESLQRGHDGIAMIALRGNVPVVPVAITGQEHLMHNLKRLRRTPVRMAFGEPFCFRAEKGLGHREQLRYMTNEAMYRLAALLPPAYRGLYGDLENATSRFLEPFEAAPGPMA